MLGNRRCEVRSKPGIISKLMCMFYFRGQLFTMAHRTVLEGQLAAVWTVHTWCSLFLDVKRIDGRYSFRLDTSWLCQLVAEIVKMAPLIPLFPCFEKLFPPTHVLYMHIQPHLNHIPTFHLLTPAIITQPSESWSSSSPILYLLYLNYSNETFSDVQSSDPTP